MEYFAGLDVSVDETAICVVGDDGQVVLETAVETDPVRSPRPWRYAARLRRVGHEAGSLSPWLHTGARDRPPGSASGDPPCACGTVSQRNKTDKADALGIAHIMRTGWFRQVHIKSRRLSAPPAADSAPQSQAQVPRPRERDPALDQGVRASSSARSGAAASRRPSREAIADDPMQPALTECMLRARAALWTGVSRLHKVVVAVARATSCASASWHSRRRVRSRALAYKTADR